MGYTTDFTGAVALGRKLSMAEAKELLELSEDGDAAEKATGIKAYFQWVPSADLLHIVWDGNEKFYKYVEQLQWLCNWLKRRDITANGSLYWQGEETGDTGTLKVSENIVTKHPNEKPQSASPRPLTLDELRAMALEQMTKA
jgi:hypothetical protein